MGSCSNSPFSSLLNDGDGGGASSMGGIRDQLLGLLGGLMSTTNYLLRLSANAYILLVFFLFFALLGHLVVRYVGRVYAAVLSLYGHRESAVEPTVLMVWELLMLVLSVAASVVVSLLWPLWLPFVLLVLGWNTLAWALSTATAVVGMSALYALRSRFASPAYWRARCRGLADAFTKSPYAVVDSDGEDEDEERKRDGEHEGDEKEDRGKGDGGLYSDIVHNAIVQLHEECENNAREDEEERGRGEE